MHPEYFINNIGNVMLPHYERLALLCFMEKHENQTIEDSHCSNSLRGILHIHRKYVLETTRGFIWKKISYTISPEGNTFLSPCRRKTGIVFKTLKQYIENIEDENPVIDDVIKNIETIVRRDFKSLADFMIQRDILRGTFKHLFVFKSLNLFKSICEEYKRKTDVSSDFSLTLFFILAKEICGDGADRFFKRIDEDETLLYEPTDSDDSETNVRIDFSGE